ncbi:glycosyltransferase family 2 protein [Alicyclobacillus ferrooxydans]|uniref:Glycosyltransferase 2-like domain-containing protein n=1 Tax=Alicyclobacillus ferrooxydans TaxID=471514 RepID=A0A0P9EI73_9BACL|nr:glycosyltransferase family 2 protein [Alicyclobacillus ferrooxydans]KPV42446.1 hypothetical protein AN477_17815 [Alicyclobacillus ferrooxydans]
MCGISVVIPSFNGLRYLVDCLRSLREQDPPFLEIIVVDNASSDGTQQYLCGQRDVIPLFNDTNEGFGRAVNRGIRMASGQYILLLNQDAVIEKNFAAHAMKAIQLFPDAGAISALLLQGDNPDLIDGAGDCLTLSFHPVKYGYGLPAVNFSLDSRHVTSGCAAACLYRRDALEQLGGFDEAIFAYLEDVDLGLRLVRAGYETILYPQMLGYHLGSTSTGSRLNEQTLYWSAKHQVYIYWKNLSWVARSLLCPIVLVSLVMRGTYYWVRHRKRSFLTGMVDGIGLIAQNKTISTGRRIKPLGVAFIASLAKDTKAVWLYRISRWRKRNLV